MIRPVVWIAIAAAGHSAPLRADTLGFVENLGQAPPAAAFVAQSRDCAAFCTAEGLRLAGPAGALFLDFEGIGAVRPRGVEPRPGRANYLLGADPARWVRGARTFAAVRWEDPSRGVGIELRGGAGRLEYDVLLAPGADAAGIAIRVRGGQFALDASGDLVVADPAGGWIQRRPQAFALGSGGARRAVDCAFRRLDDERFGFELGPLAAGDACTIDPTLVAATWVGGGLVEDAMAVALAPDGAAFVAGATKSLDFPVAPGAIQPGYGGGQTDAFVAGVAPDGKTLLFATWLGGIRSETLNELVLGPQGDLVVAGETNSPDFPTTAGAFQTTFGGGGERDATIASLGADGATLLWSTYLGGNDQDYAHGLAVDAAGSVYVAGHVHSANFPVTAGAFSTTTAGHNSFVTKLAPGGWALAWSSFLSANSDAHIYALALDGQLRPTIVGEALAGLPVTPGAFDATVFGTKDAFAVRFAADGASLSYATYFGGGGDADIPLAAVATAGGEVCFTGVASSADLPVTPGALDAQLGGIADAFVARLSAAGDALAFATYLGGGAYDTSGGVAIDASGSIVVAGTAGPGFPLTADSLQPAVSGAGDAFVARLDGAGATLLHASALGGGGAEPATALAPGPGRRAAIAGTTDSANFPATAGAAQPALGGARDAFVAVVDLCPGAFHPGGGSGCPGSGGFTPLLAGSGCPASGEAIGLALSDGLGGATAVLLFGLGSGPLPLNGACSLALAPLLPQLAIVLPLGGSGPGQGALALSATLPPALAAIALRMQLVVSDPGAAGKLAASAPLEIALAP